jgi:hypothetical protein
MFNTNKTGHHVLYYTWHLLKVSLNTNKTGQHDLRYNWHIVESGIQPQYTFNNVSGITLNMVTSFIGV